MDRRSPNARRRWPWALAALLALLIVFVGPWPLPADRYPDEPWAEATFQRLAELPVTRARGPLQVGVGRADITPPPGVPLAGYGARHPKENTGAREPLYATAVTFAVGGQAVTMLGGDYLLPLPKLVAAVRAATGLPPEALYFTASHSHSGPGGYDDGLVARTNLGDFHPQYFRRLVAAMAEAVSASRARLEPARLRYSRLRLTGGAARLSIYRLTHAPVYPVIHVLEAFAADGRRLACLVTSAIHPTVLGKHNRLASGDYPAPLARALEKDGGRVLFAAGAVGGTVPGVGEGDDPAAQDRARARLAARLAGLIRSGLAGGGEGVRLTARWTGDPGLLARARLRVALPPPLYHLGEHLRLSPLLVRALFHPAGHTWLDGLRLGPLWFVGIPADFSPELAEGLDAWARARGGHAWITGFNGDYLGYLMPKGRYATPHYTTRNANLYGPAAGDYFRDLARALMERLTGSAP